MTKLPKIIYYFFFTVYLLFPNEIKDFGIGPPGMRVLVLDIFVIMIILSSLLGIFLTLPNALKLIPKFGFILFAAAVLLSLIRGLPDYGGLAIGEARWFLSAILIFIGFSFYDDQVLKTTIKILHFAAIVHSIIILFRFFWGIPSNLEDQILRFGTGRQSFIIYLSVLFLFIDMSMNSFKDFKKITFLSCYILVLLLSQTRTIFLLLPITIFIIYLMLKKIRIMPILKFVFYSSITIIILLITIQLIFKQKLEKSIFSSIEILTEAIQLPTYKIILNPELMEVYSEDFSGAGNTLWRAYAWGQTIQNISDAKLGWLIGLPMGSGYQFYDPGGQLIESLEPHNDYISIVSKIGLIGLLGYFLIVYRYFKYFFQVKGTIEDNKEKLKAALLLFTIILSLLLFSFTNDEIRTYGTYFWVWIFLGFGFRFIYENKNAEVLNQSYA